MKAILKNTEKYGNIKLAKGLLLDETKTVKRGGEIGVSTKKYGKVWFCLPKGRAIFKTYDDIFCFDIRQNRIVNELLCKELCNQVGIKCPEIEPASKNGVEGIVSYNVAKRGEELIDAMDLGRLVRFSDFTNSLEDYAYIADELQSLGYNVNKKQFVDDIYKICVFDFLTMQTDRHESNLFFIKDKKEREIKVAPLIDNEFAFCGKALIKFISKNYIEENDVKEQYQNFSSFIRIKTNYCLNLDTRATEIATLAKNDKRFKKILSDIVQKMNIKTAINKVENMGYEIAPEYKEYLENITEYSTELLLNKYKELKVDKSKYIEDFDLLY